jgi:hypothetical protein
VSRSCSCGWSSASHRGGPRSILGRSAWNFVVDGLALGRVFLGVLRFSPVIVIPRILHIYSSITDGM